MVLGRGLCVLPAVCAEGALFCFLPRAWGMCGNIRRRRGTCLVWEHGVVFIEKKPLGRYKMIVVVVEYTVLSYSTTGRSDAIVRARPPRL